MSRPGGRPYSKHLYVCANGAWCRRLADWFRRAIRNGLAAIAAKVRIKSDDEEALKVYVRHEALPQSEMPIGRSFQKFIRPSQH